MMTMKMSKNIPCEVLKIKGFCKKSKVLVYIYTYSV